MKTLIVNILLSATMLLTFSVAAFGQAHCDREYRACVSTCNATANRTRSQNQLQRSQIRLQLNRDLIQCNIQFHDLRARQQCRREKQAAANAALAELDRSDRQAERDRITCISDCRTRLRECRQPPSPQPIVGGDFEVDCVEGGPPCRGAVSEFCQRAQGACDDCWRSLCGGGDWLIDSDSPLRSVTLVAVSASKRSRVLATSYLNGRRSRLNVPRNLRLRTGEQLYFEFSPRRRMRGPVKITIHRDR